MKEKLVIILVFLLCHVFCMGCQKTEKETVHVKIASEEKKSTYEENGVCFHVYEPKGENTCWITHIDIENQKESRTLVIPKTIYGKNVIKIGNLPFRDEQDIYNIFGMYVQPGENLWGPENKWKEVCHIKEIVLPDTIQEILPGTFAGLMRLEKVRLSTQLKKVGNLAFDGCNNLKSIYIPENVSEGLEELLQGNWEEFQISKLNPYYKMENDLLLSKNGKVLYGLTKLKEKVVIPESVEQIKERAFESQTSLDISLSKGNKVFSFDENCIYTKKGRKLVVAIVVDDVLNISDKVERI